VWNVLKRKKHKLQGNNYNCVPCAAHCEVTMFHLFFACAFSVACWRHLRINWRFDLDFHSMMEEANAHFSNKFFMEIFILGAWLIWKQRNVTRSLTEADLPSKAGSWVSSRKLILRLS
jgi:hypothetical protein